ncbi:Protein of unknown function [Chishuiella changwenlii]|uniref:DUF3667 domain-containing protein n=1 Tax=Chishuiella changwenlii TaxID=1434701 RepID=A0A1M6SXD8_9FLAO|nr:DUF3667 domain-containing protein [Chishuiella changwenlii]GGF08976.1 hypothetical protein GCM10010984_27640 [Chishuiella changwenlii]SHK49381.1 Protein of unknown function [Chishuiella changwenlii]
MNCKNCNNEVHLNYCSNCGQPVKLKRINAYYILHEIEHILHFERGILYTIKELTLNPGKSIKTYITENRSKLVKPIIFIIVTSLIYTFCNHYFHFEDGYINYHDEKSSAIKDIFKWIQAHYGYANIIIGVFISLWAKLFFRKYEFNFFEILILLCFITGISMLIYSVFGILQYFTHYNLMQVSSVVGLLYIVWAMGQFFDKRKLINYLKAFISYVLGILTFSITLILIGALVDSILKH